jgi:UDP-N-acetyl-D-mannosaminuronate dehydrogenase
VDPSYLSFSAANIGIETQLIDLADKVNQSTPLKIAMRIKSLLGNELMGRKIQFAGIAYKPNTSDTRESPTLVLMTELRKLGAEVKWFDPLVESLGSEASEPLDIHSDLGIITVPHDQIDFLPWVQAGTNVIDLSISKQNYGWPKFL